MPGLCTTRRNPRDPPGSTTPRIPKQDQGDTGQGRVIVEESPLPLLRANGLLEQIMFSEDSLPGPVSVRLLDRDPKEGLVHEARWDFVLDA